jgi:hypothetical protein
MDTGWDFWTRFWIHPSSTIHLALDVGGMTPGIGIVFDLANAGLYHFEGDLVNAGVAAGAAIPVLGQGVTAAKFASAGGSIVFVSVRRGERVFDAALDATGKVHGVLPHPKDLGKYGIYELMRLRDELAQSVQTRIEVTARLGADFGHSNRLADEQQLIKSLEKILQDR